MPPEPPPYTPHQGPYYPAPPPAYMAPAGGVNGFVPPTHVFPDSPPGKFKRCLISKTYKIPTKNLTSFIAVEY